MIGRLFDLIPKAKKMSSFVYSVTMRRWLDEELAQVPDWNWWESLDLHQDCSLVRLPLLVLGYSPEVEQFIRMACSGHS